MNSNQKISLVVGAAAISLMLLFPPFQAQIRDATVNMGYGFILDPPRRGYVVASVNSGMLLVQWIGTLLLTALAFFLLKGADNNKHSATNGNIGNSQLPDPSQTAEAEINQSKSFLGGQHHPWRRFFARTVDVSTIGLALVFAAAFGIGYLLPEKAEGFVKSLENPIIAGFIIYFMLLPVEATFLATMGTTPGKWLFGIRVLRDDGTRLFFGDALHRAFLVWVQGVGLGIPLVSFITQLYAYRRLTATGTTLWDKSANSIVTHQRWGVIRSLMCVVVVVAVLFLLSILNNIGNQPNG
ncbi:MAG: RDD family protein [Desulfobulbaceae bacterium]